MSKNSFLATQITRISALFWQQHCFGALLSMESNYDGLICLFFHHYTEQDWLKTPSAFRFTRSKTKANHDSLVHIFLRFASVLCVFLWFHFVWFNGLSRREGGGGRPNTRERRKSSLWIVYLFNLWLPSVIDLGLVLKLSIENHSNLLYIRDKTLKNLKLNNLL